MFNLFYKQIFYLKNKIVNNFYMKEKKKKKKMIKTLILDYNKRILIILS
jgi:hypothetical protein